MELKTETLAQLYQKALTYQQVILQEEFARAIRELDSKTLIELILTYPTYVNFSMKDAFLVVGSIEDEDKAIEFLELLFVNQRFHKNCFYDAFQSMIYIAVIGRQLKVLIFLLKKNCEFDSNGPEIRFVTHATPRLTRVVAKKELVLDSEGGGEHFETRTNPEYHYFFDTLVNSLLKQDPKFLIPFAGELVNHYKNRTINLKPEILLSLIEQFYFSENNENGLALVNNLLPWAVKNGHAKIVRLFYRDKNIPEHFINKAMSETQASILYKLIIELHWSTISCLLAAKSDENTLLGPLLIKELNDYIAGLFVYMQASSDANSPESHLNLICDFLQKERTRLKTEYSGTNFINNIASSVSNKSTVGDNYGNLLTDYPKPRRLQYIENYIRSNMISFAHDDIPIIIMLIQAVCAVKNHFWSGEPTSLTNFSTFCSDNSFTCTADEVLSEERLLELFKSDRNVKLALDEVRQASKTVLGLK